MLDKVLSDSLYSAFFVGGLIALLVVFEVVFDCVYCMSPKFRSWWNNYCDKLPDYDQEENSNGCKY